MIIPRNPKTLKSPAMMVRNRTMAKSLARARSPVATPRNPDERKTRAKTKYKGSV